MPATGAAAASADTVGLSPMRRPPSHARQSSAGASHANYLVAVPVAASQSVTTSGATPSSRAAEPSPNHAGSRPKHHQAQGGQGQPQRVNFLLSPQRSTGDPRRAGPDDQFVLPPMAATAGGYPVRIIAHGMDMPRVIEDPSAYRPATPILNWQGPARSVRPPTLQFWHVLTLLVALSTIGAGVIPGYLVDGQTEFLVSWVAITALGTGFFAYMSTSRHLSGIAMQMQGISTPSDIDYVLEELQRSRFSRFEETWKVQVHLILMFCRILRHHHGVPTLPSAYGYATALSDEEGGLVDDGDDGGGNEHDEFAESFNRSQEPPVGSVEGMLPPNITRTMARRNSSSQVINPIMSLIKGLVPSDADCDGDESLFSAISADERERGALAAAGRIGSPALMRRSTTRFPPGSPGPSGRRTRKVNGDPLCDNEKPWQEVMTAGGPEGPPRSLFLQLVKQVKLGEDLSKVVLPVHILEPRSLLEKISDLFVHPDLLGAVNGPEDPTERIRGVCQWFLSAYNMRPIGVKKPYNPILGETFECTFAPGTDDELWYFAEQVSHHPPITCFRAVHRRTQIEVMGSYVPRSRLVTPNTGASMGEGFFDVYVPRVNESFRIGWPSAYVSGILSPPLRLELVGKVDVTSKSSPVRAEIHFERKPYFGGDYDVVRGGIFPGQSKYPSFVIAGRWHSRTDIARRVEQVSLSKTCPTDEPCGALFDPDTASPPVRPTAGLTSFPKPSRLVWNQVTVALRGGDAEAAQKGKIAIETQERDERRAREARGEQYVPGYFRIVGDVKGVGKDTWRYVGPPAFGVESPIVPGLSTSRLNASASFAAAVGPSTPRPLTASVPALPSWASPSQEAPLA